MSFERRIVRAAGWGLTHKLGQHLLRFIVLVALARMLAPADFGLFALASVFIMLADIVIEQGLADAVIQRHRIGRAHLEAAFWLMSGCGLLFAGLYVALAGPLAALLDQPALAPVLRVLALPVLFGALSRTHEALLRRRMAFKQAALIGVFAMGVGAGAAVWAALEGLGVWSLVIQHSVFRATEMLCLWGAARWWPRLRCSLHHCRLLMRYGTPLLGVGLLNFTNRQADHLMIGVFLGPTALGYYSVGIRLMRMLLDVLPMAFVPVMFSALSRLQAEPERLRAALRKGVRGVALLCMPAFIGMALVAPEAVPLLFGQQWQPSVPLMQVLVFLGVLQSVSLFYPAALKALGHTPWVLALAGLNAVVNVTAFAVAVHWGVLAVAVAYVLRGYILWPLNMWVWRRCIQVSYRQILSPLAEALTATAAMAFGVWMLREYLAGWPDVTVLAASVALGIVLYGLVLWLLLGRRLKDWRGEANPLLYSPNISPRRPTTSR